MRRIVVRRIERSPGYSTYLSPAIQNELIKIMAEQIKWQIAEKIKGEAFALMADESRDNGGHEQLSIVIRIVVNANNHKHIIQEYFIGLIRLHEFDAQILSNEIVNYFTNYGVKLDSCIAQCYDEYIPSQLSLEESPGSPQGFRSFAGTPWGLPGELSGQNR
ncbi:unnamed protein product [Rotaria socialis]|uniref:DUF4371 domain-containing protein n=1 Tax=Rotaria socialis TaxID=392032 RepID=A0A820UYD1_9BILA|nr:unnamed protein product [Rotaria socialis]CAF4492445.1 unnamed protein product [Rotaria socialis]